MITMSEMVDRAEWRREIEENLKFIRHEVAAILANEAKIPDLSHKIDTVQSAANVYRLCDSLEAKARAMMEVRR